MYTVLKHHSRKLHWRGGGRKPSSILILELYLGEQLTPLYGRHYYRENVIIQFSSFIHSCAWQQPITVKH
jgi:hypothetical protein